MKTQEQQRLNKFSFLICLFCLFGFVNSLMGQNISIKKANGLYKAINLNIDNDSLNYILAGNFKPKILNDSVVSIYKANCVPELSSACSFSIMNLLFTDGKKMIASYGFYVSFPHSRYFLKVNKTCGKWVFKLNYNNKVYTVKEKLKDNPKDFVQSIADKFNAFGIKDLKCEYTVTIK